MAIHTPDGSVAVSDQQLKVPKRTLKPSPGRVLLVRLPIEGMTVDPIGGGLIHKSVQQIEEELMTNPHAVVVRIGPPRRLMDGSLLTPWFEPRQEVIVIWSLLKEVRLSREDSLWEAPYDAITAVWVDDESNEVTH